MTHKLASAALRTTRAMFVAAPTALAEVYELPPLEEADDDFVEEVESAAADEEQAAAAPPSAEEDEPPFDAPDSDDEIFCVRRSVLELDEAAPDAAVVAANANEPASPSVRLAPAISIHVNWDRDEAAALAAGLEADARLARTEISNSGGGIEAAVRRFSKKRSPDVLVLHTASEAEAIVSGLDRLLFVLDPRTRIMVIGAVNDVGLLRDLARRGVGQYVLAPVKADEMARAICDMFAETDTSRVIAVIGARGGAGASTVAHNVAWAIAERQDASTTLVELDLSFGVAAWARNQEVKHTLADALIAPQCPEDGFFDRVALTHSDRLKILAAPATLERPFDLNAPTVAAVIKRVRRMSAFVVLDLPQRWESWTKETLKSADHVVIVATPDLASLRNAKNMLEVLKAERGAEREPMLLLSMIGAAKGTEISVKDFTDAVGVKPVEALEFDPALFGMSTVKGVTLSELAPRSKPALALDALAWVLTGREPVNVKRRRRTKATAQGAAVLALDTIQRPLPEIPAADMPAKAPVAAPTVVADVSLERAAAMARAKRHQRSYAHTQPMPPPRGKPGTVRAAFAVLALSMATVAVAHDPALADVIVKLALAR